MNQPIRSRIPNSARRCWLRNVLFGLFLFYALCFWDENGRAIKFFECQVVVGLRVFLSASWLESVSPQIGKTSPQILFFLFGCDPRRWIQHVELSLDISEQV